MSKVRAQITVSADGYVAGRNPTEQQPLGEGGERLHAWAWVLRAFNEPHGRDEGVVNASTQVVCSSTVRSPRTPTKKVA